MRSPSRWTPALCGRGLPPGRARALQRRTGSPCGRGRSARWPRSRPDEPCPARLSTIAGRCALRFGSRPRATGRAVCGRSWVGCPCCGDACRDLADEAFELGLGVGVQTVHALEDRRDVRSRVPDPGADFPLGHTAGYELPDFRRYRWVWWRLRCTAGATPLGCCFARLGDVDDMQHRTGVLRCPYGRYRSCPPLRTQRQLVALWDGLCPPLRTVVSAAADVRCFSDAPEKQSRAASGPGGWRRLARRCEPRHRPSGDVPRRSARPPGHSRPRLVARSSATGAPPARASLPRWRARGSQRRRARPAPRMQRCGRCPRPRHPERRTANHHYGPGCRSSGP